ncbi:sensor histidine kinase [Vitiosangium sp. GDMCC 1.1324]|uniref:sensor histidine kinase n=1 Tax=Vitiosangium sp. (strain GDMCC 1.1324) TaxID=2138576 RepID=UPI000D33C055|nr:histidine kinase [Vitiosangium sp. GDMCC 1.1324]PTL76101.1 two-component sensor histidine kinase [Vitiosangium sp. GDMCC 1.1324]
MAPSHVHRVLLGAGLLTWALAGLPQVLWLVAEPARMGEPSSVVWLVAFTVFGGAFLLNARDAETHVGLLLLQTVAALGVLATSGSGFEGALLAINAGQVPALLPPRRAVAWVTVQGLAALAVYLVIYPPARAWMTAAIYGGFQAFALAVAWLAEREAQGRRELARLHAELRAAQVLLAEGERERERLRIARELHDSLGHHLTALTLNLEVAAHSAQGSAVEHVRRAQGVARGLLSEVRTVVSALRDSPPQLAPALRALAEDVPGLAVHLQVPEALPLGSSEAARSLFRCVQEVITNTLRHASASNLWIDITATPDGVRVLARDDGRGAPALKAGAGLTGMRERFVELGGRVEVRSPPGRGLELEAWLPGSEGAA